MNDLSNTPEYILRYMAPMACGEKERAELIRRREQEIGQLARQLYADDCKDRGAMMQGGFGFLSQGDKYPWLEKASKIVFERHRS